MRVVAGAARGTTWDRVGPHGTTWDHVGPHGTPGTDPFRVITTAVAMRQGGELAMKARLWVMVKLEAMAEATVVGRGKDDG